MHGAENWGESVENSVRGDYFKAKTKAASKTKPKTIHKTRRQAGGLYTYNMLCYKTF